MGDFARVLQACAVAAVVVSAVACSPSGTDPLSNTFATDEPISAQKLGAALAARAGTDAARDVAYVVEGALITRCDEGRRDGLITSTSERVCLSSMTLDDAWAARVSTLLDTPAAISEPGLMLLLLAVAIVVSCPWAVDRSVRMAGWRLQHFTDGAWYRLWMPVRYAVALLAGAPCWRSRSVRC